jgi:hypothetical protein
MGEWSEWGAQGAAGAAGGAREHLHSHGVEHVRAFQVKHVQNFYQVTLMSSRQDGYLVDDSQGFDEFLGAFFLGLLAAATN